MKQQLEEMAREKGVSLAKINVNNQRLFYVKKHMQLLNNGYPMTRVETVEFLSDLKPTER